MTERSVGDSTGARPATGSDIAVGELAKVMATEEVFLLDVREEDEVARAAIPQAHHISMNDIVDRIAELPKDKIIYVFCHHGSRSKMVCQYLNKNGFRAVNITGGIHRYALEVDPTIPTY